LIIEKQGFNELCFFIIFLSAFLFGKKAERKENDRKDFFIGKFSLHSLKFQSSLCCDYKIFNAYYVQFTSIKIQ